MVMIELNRPIIGADNPPPSIRFKMAKLTYCIVIACLSIIQWIVQRETIAMNGSQTVGLMHLLAEKRKASGFSVAEVGQRAGVNRSTVWRLEQGMMATPRGDSLIAIGKVLNIPAADLLATVGWLTAGELPTVGPYLRTKYDQLPEAAIVDIENRITTLLHRYRTATTKHAGLQHPWPPKEI